MPKKAKLTKILTRIFGLAKMKMKSKKMKKTKRTWTKIKQNVIKVKNQKVMMIILRTTNRISQKCPRTKTNEQGMMKSSKIPKSWKWTMRLMVKTSLLNLKILIWEMMP